MKSLITEKAAVGSGSRQGVIQILLFFVLVFGGSRISAQSVPIYTFDAFEKFLKPESDTVYVINFWATWCKPCVEELPHFEKLTENYKDKKVKVLLVNIDFRSQYEKKVVPFVQKNKLKSQVMMLDTQGDNGFIDKVSTAWQGTIPATVIVQASSKTNKFYEKQFTYDQLETIVKPLIKM